MKRFAVTAALVVSTVLVIAQPASASWQQQSTPTPSGSNPTWSLSAVSCTATATCMAVGNVGSSLLSESRSGSTWTIVSIPDPGGGQLPGIWCTSSSSCEAVGQFDSGGTTETLAEEWNGSSWSVQSTPNPAGVTSSQLNDVSCVSASRCEAVGEATISGGNIETLAEEWNGSNWAIKNTQDVGGAIISKLSGVSCTSATVCEAVGESRTGSNFPALAEVWNGSNWTIQSASLGTFSPLEGVSCTAANGCTATGSGLAARWDGSNWTMQAIAKPGGSTGSVDLSRVSCTDKTRCMAVGSFPKDAVETAIAEQWDGTSWKIKPTPITSANDSSGLSDVSCTFATACTGAGFYHDPNGPNHALAEDWSLRWQLQAPLIPFDNPLASSLDAVSCPSTAFCAAVGGEEPTGGVFDALAEIFKGQAWLITSTPNASNSNLDAVSCTGAKACTAVGDVDTGGGTLSTLAERWDGTNWTVQSTPSPAGAVHSFLTAVSCPSAKSCIAVGFFTNGSGNQTPFAEHWNGTNWTIKTTPSPPVDPATQLNSVSCMSSTSCEAVGTSTTQTWAEVWNGTNWAMQSIPSPAGGSDVRLRGVSCTASNACTGVGAYFNGTKLVPLAERGNGSTWAVQAAAVPSGSSSQFSSVSCGTTQFNIGCNAVGSVTKNGIILPLAENWNGSAWAVKPTQSPDPNVTRSNMTSVSCSSLITCMGIGFYDTSTGVEAPLGEQYS